jgi:molecular chaperone DnaK (HSP70)
MSSEAIYPVGVDLGNWNARVAAYDEALGHSVMVYNQDGHRTTRAVVEAAAVDGQPTSGINAPVGPSVFQVMQGQQNPSDDAEYENEQKTLISDFLKRILGLACDSYHAPMSQMRVVTSLPYEGNGDGTTSSTSKTTADVLKSCIEGDSCNGFCLEPTATCLAYNPSPELEHLLVVDGGGSGLKVSLVKQVVVATANGNNDGSPSSSPRVWSILHHQTTHQVSGALLIGELGQFVAQQFETKHRFPKGEVWSSKKVKNKLFLACESGLTTLYQSNNVTIHVDGLYEGMDCQVTISKPRWEMVSSKYANHAKETIKQVVAHAEGFTKIDAVLMSGNLHSWLRPLVESVMPKDGCKILPTPFSFDPAEAVALGCAMQAYLNLQDGNDREGPNLMETQRLVPLSPVSIGIDHVAAVESSEKSTSGSAEGDDDTAATPTTILIGKGTPLPAVATYRFNAGSSSNGEVAVWQVEPILKKLAVLDDKNNDDDGGSDDASPTSVLVRIQLSQTGQLTIAMGGEHIGIGQ